MFTVRQTPNTGGYQRFTGHCENILAITGELLAVMNEIQAARKIPTNAKTKNPVPS